MKRIEISVENLVHLGDGEIAYVKAIRSEDVPALFPKLPEIQPGLKLFALHAADGTPILLTDSREVAIANAMNQQTRNCQRTLNDTIRLLITGYAALAEGIANSA